MRTDLPSGTVTFLFTDVEGSTRLLHELGAEEYADALAEHRTLIRAACTAEGGAEVDTQGDAFFFAFPTAPGALAAASAFRQALASTLIRVRVGLHTGTPLLAGEGYVGHDVHRAARVAAAAHGGQVVVSSATAALLDRDALRDLGEHRFKDLSAPERVYQLGEGDFPPLKTLYRTNLPVPATPFLGREAELREVTALLGDDATRLVTLTGAGGTGKTRLALQAVAEVSDDFPDGVYWVPLAPLRDATLVLTTTAVALSVREEAGLSARDALAGHIGSKRLILLFDNFEHLIETAPELSPLLEACPALTILVTSRETLRLQEEREYPVPTLAADEGVRLFCERARVEPSPVIAEICSRLDSLPLALELAAARMKLLSAEQLLERLSRRLDLLKAGRGADPRQQTLRATIEWSHDLLSPEEKLLFARLSVFAGGCTLDAAEEVCDADLDVLESLLDKSLLRRRETALEPRFWMLETIREFAREQLANAAETDELQRQHAKWCATLVREADRSRGGPDYGRWVQELDEEHSNLRVALEWARIESPALLGEFARLLWRSWLDGENLGEASLWLEEALAQLPPTPTREREDLLGGASWAAFYRGDLATARARGEERLAVARDLGDGRAIAGSLSVLGGVAQEEGDFERAVALGEEAVAVCRSDDGAAAGLATMIHNLGVAWERAGDGRRAGAAFEEALALHRAADDRGQIAAELMSLGAAALLQGGHVEARRTLLAGMRLAREEHVARGFLPLNLVTLACAEAEEGRVLRAARLLGAVDRALEETGESPPSQHQQRFDDLRATLTTQIGEDDLARLWAEGREMHLEEAVDYALQAPDANG